MIYYLPRWRKKHDWRNFEGRKKSCSEIFKFEVILRDVNLAVGNTFLDFKERKRLET